MRTAGSVVVVLAVLLGPAAGCGWFDDDGPRVLVVGDSVTRLSQEEIRQELGWAGTLDIRAHDGHRTDELVGTARDGAVADPDIALVMVGYNDILQDRVEQAAVAQMVDAVAEVGCTVWFLLPGDGGYAPDDAERFNARVRDAVADHPAIHLSEEWLQLVERSPTFTFVSDLDAVHPNDAGQRAIARVMAAAADRECR